MDAEGLSATEEAELEPESAEAEGTEVATGAEPANSPDGAEVVEGATGAEPANSPDAGEVAEGPTAVESMGPDPAAEQGQKPSKDDPTVLADEDSATSAEGESSMPEQADDLSEQVADAEQRLGDEDQKLAGIAADLKPVINRSRIERFLIGFLFALAFYLIEAGLAEILLARNAACLESLNQYRLAPNPFEVCMSELGLFATHSVSRGFFGPDAPGIIAWPVMGLLYALAGGGLAQLSRRQAVGAFLILQTIIVALFTAIGYLSQFIV